MTTLLENVELARQHNGLAGTARYVPQLVERVKELEAEIERLRTYLAEVKPFIGCLKYIEPGVGEVYINPPELAKDDGRTYTVPATECLLPADIVSKVP